MSYVQSTSMQHCREVVKNKRYRFRLCYRKLLIRFKKPENSQRRTDAGDALPLI